MEDGRWPITQSERSFGSGVSAPSTGTAERGSYLGTASSLALTARQAQYNRIVQSNVIATPPAASSAGFKSGWHGRYEDSSPFAGADVALYVYNTQRDASAAYVNACPNCKRYQTIHGIRLRYFHFRARGLPVFTAISTCRNLYVVVFTSATHESWRELGYDAGSEVIALLEEANRHGMAACKVM